MAADVSILFRTTKEDRASLIPRGLQDARRVASLYGVVSCSMLGWRSIPLKSMAPLGTCVGSRRGHGPRQRYGLLRTGLR
jgi:hypothetical protein